MKHEVTQHPIRPTLIGRKWHVTNDDTGEVLGPFESSWQAIERCQTLREGHAGIAATAETARQRGKRDYREVQGR